MPMSSETHLHLLSPALISHSWLPTTRRRVLTSGSTFGGPKPEQMVNVKEIPSPFHYRSTHKIHLYKAKLEKSKGWSHSN